MSHLICELVLKARLRKWTDSEMTTAGASRNFAVERAKNGCPLRACLSASACLRDTTLHAFDCARLHLHVPISLSNKRHGGRKWQRLHKAQIRGKKQTCRKKGAAQQTCAQLSLTFTQSPTLLSHSRERTPQFSPSLKEVLCGGGFSGEAVQIQGSQDQTQPTGCTTTGRFL